jgi:biotin-dependent carboxylase-like uncharacterized protein
MIEILQLGWHTTIQDLGRFGQQSLGVPISGAMDLNAFNWANKLLNNDPNDACFEITIKGPILKFHRATYITITGAKVRLTLNKDHIEMYKPISIKKGDILHISNTTVGCRVYIAILGGFQTETVLGSKSQFKGLTFNDRIDKKSVIAINKIPFVTKLAGIKAHLIDYSNINLKVYIGPEYYLLNTSSRNSLKIKQFTISSQNNRMGYRLNEKIKQQLPEIWTAPTLPGTVQLTPEGTLIILMRDAQVTGGYARIFQLTDDAINLLAQKSTLDQLKFEIIRYKE